MCVCVFYKKYINQKNPGFHTLCGGFNFTDKCYRSEFPTLCWILLMMEDFVASIF